MGDPSQPPGLRLVQDNKRLQKRVRELEKQVRFAGATRRNSFTSAALAAFSMTTTSQVVTVTWPVAFKDTSYTVVPNLVVPSGYTAPTSIQISAKTVTGCTVTVYAGGGVIAAGSVLTVDALHL